MRPTAFTALALAFTTASISASAQQPAPPAASQPAAAPLAGASAHPGPIRWRRASDPVPAGANAEEVARAYLDAVRDEYGVSAQAVASAEVLRVHDTGRGGIIVVFGQQVDGVEVFEQRTNVALRRDLAPVAITGGLHPAAVDGLSHVVTFTLAAEAAVHSAVADMAGVSLPAGAITATGQSQGPYRYFDIDWGSAAGDFTPTPPTRVKPVFFPSPSGLEPAYYLELELARHGVPTTEAFGYVVSARDGDVLLRRDLVQHVEYRVWADPVSRAPFDSPYGSGAIPQPADVEPSAADVVSQEDVEVADGLFGLGRPWVYGSETVGNNADSYIDAEGNDGLDLGDFRAAMTAAGTFAHTYDLSTGPDATVANLSAELVHQFYVVNYLHDRYYGHGFDEAAGNAQDDNFGLGGYEGDSMRVEAHDFSGVFNANMYTPADGGRPRMQMFLFPPNFVTVRFLAPTLGDVQAGLGFFAPMVPTDGPAAWLDDGFGGISDGCEFIFDDLSDQIAVFEWGGCPAAQSLLNAQDAGAEAVVYLTSDLGGGGGAFPFDCGDPFGCPIGRLRDARISAVTLDAATSDTVRALQGDEVVFDLAFPEPAHSSAVDSMVLAHEWGHYLLGRLMGSPGNQQGAALNEGTADFVALLFTIEEEDLDVPTNESLGARYAVGPWVTNDPVLGNFWGIRRAPYSTRFDVNPLTLRHIARGEPAPEGDLLRYFDPENNSQVHASGEIWALSLLACYRNLIEQHGFAEAQARMHEYMVAGLTLAPRDPTYVELRDAFVIAAYGRDAVDGALFWEGFAERGLGMFAVAPQRNDIDHAGVVESFVGDASLPTVGGLVVEVAASECDADGVWDIGEWAFATVNLENRGRDLAGEYELRIEVSAQSAGVVSFPLGDTVRVPTIGEWSAETVRVPMILEDADPGEVLALTVHLTTPGTEDLVVPLVEGLVRVHHDVAPESSRRFDGEAPAFGWGASADPRFGDDAAWRLESRGALDQFLHADNPPFQADLYLSTPLFEVGDGEDFVVRFRHSYAFQTYPDVPELTQDGGVVLGSFDGGTSYFDAAVDYYTGTVIDIVTLGGEPEQRNPITGANAFVGSNLELPEPEWVELNFGRELAGESVFFLFRLATDTFLGDYGWDIYDFEVEGTINTPFASLVDETDLCTVEPPIADAGADFTVEELQEGRLDGRGSEDPMDFGIAFEWTQTGGPDVSISDRTVPRPRFTAPDVSEDTELTFSLVVETEDGRFSEPDEVVVTVLDVEPVPDPDPDPDVEADAGSDASDMGADLDLGTDPAPDAVEDATLDATTDATPDVAPDATTDATPDVAPDATPDATPDVAPDATPDARPDATPDATPDAEADARPDATPDATPDARPDAAPDATPDAEADANPDDVSGADPDRDTADDAPPATGGSDDDDGCSVTGRRAPGIWVLAIALVVWRSRRRRECRVKHGT